MVTMSIRVFSMSSFFASGLTSACFDGGEEVGHEVRSVLRRELRLDGAGVRSRVEQVLDAADVVVVVGDSAVAIISADLNLHVVDGVPDRDFGGDIRPDSGGVLQRSLTERLLRLRAAQAGGDRQRDRRALRACDVRNGTGCGMGCQRMIFRWTEGDARGRRVAIHMCIRMRWKSTRAIATGDVRGRAAPRTGRGTRGGARFDRATTYRAWREGCVWFSGARAGRWRLETRGTSSSELRSKGGGETRVCRHTPKVAAVYRSEVPGEA